MKAEILRNLKKLNLSGYTLETNSIRDIEGIPCRDVSVDYVQIVRAFLTTIESRNYYTLEDVTTRFFELYTDPEDFIYDYSELLAQLSTRRAREFI